MTPLELLAPARNTEIGIAAIDCGADAVYIAGPSFGARQDAGNSIEDIKKLCDYAARFGVRIYATVNTILYDSELDKAADLMLALQDAGVSGYIVQDPAVVKLASERGIHIPLHASTQCAIRTPEKARFYEDCGFSRVVLERQLSLDEIRKIREGISAEIEFFVHGALCVCYSGQCYLSEYLSGRSANRGECVQACRSLYDLVDASGKVLSRDKALLSLKDYNLSARLGELADAGVCSFKVEGRLKNISYVRNITAFYSDELDMLVSLHPDKYIRASFGHVTGRFTPNPDKTFNRGYTELYIDGRTPGCSSMEIPKGRGEEVGIIRSVMPLSHGNMEVKVGRLPGVSFANGDGFICYGESGIIGFRGDICQGDRVTAAFQNGLKRGMKLYRNLDIVFEKSVASHPGQRHIPVAVSLGFSKEGNNYIAHAKARSEDGREVEVEQDCGQVAADNQSRIMSMLEGQFSRRSGIYSFSLSEVVDGGHLPLVSAALLNGIRRSIAEKLDGIQCKAHPLYNKGLATSPDGYVQGKDITYKYNVANGISRDFYLSRGATQVDSAYEISHPYGAELMRSRYCIRRELGMCLKDKTTKNREPLYLVNNGRRLSLGFDCENCEMTVSPYSR